jgi:copper(I)-binding protein
MRKLVLSAIAVSLVAAPALAANLTVSDAWFRALPAKLPAGGYFTLRNAGAVSASLTGASSPACGMLMLHKSDMGSGMASMEMVDGIAIPAGGSVSFSPGGYHLMCTDPTSTMKPGTKVPVTLEFEGGAKLTAVFAVKDARGR